MRNVCKAGLESPAFGAMALKVAIWRYKSKSSIYERQQSAIATKTIMARYQLFSSLLLLVILVAYTAAEAPRRLRYNRQRQAFARQVVQPTPYPSANELKPEEPALIYGPPPSTDVDELPAEEEQPTNSFQPNVEAEPEPLEPEENSLEETTPAASARLRNGRQRLAKLQLAKKQSKRQRIARLEAVPLPVEAPIQAVPQYYFVNAQLQQQQPLYVAYNPSAQQLSW